MLHGWRKAVDAQMPTPNPQYDPAKTLKPEEQRAELALLLRMAED